MRATCLLLIAAGCVYGASPLFSRLLGGSGQDYATSVTSDAQGNVYVAGLTYSPDFPVTPGAMQTKFGQTSDAFIVKLDPSGNIVWSTYLGGILDDWATGIALDAQGNVLVTGYTRSPDFPLVHPIQSTYNNGVTDDYDAFVAKLDPTGATLLYSTFLGGNLDDGGAGIAVDTAGDAIVAISSASATGFPGLQGSGYGIVVSKLDPKGVLLGSYFHPAGSAAAITLDTAGSIYVAGSVLTHAIAFKLAPDLTKELYETTLAGSSQDVAGAIAVDSAGSVWLAGSTTSVDFPLVHPLQSSLGARPVWRTTDGGANWTPLDNLPFAQPVALVADPATPTTLYEASADRGIFKSVDGGTTWTAANSGITGTNIAALAVDPVHPQTLYAAVSAPTSSQPSSTVYKSVNGAASWTVVDAGAFNVSQLAVDPQNDSVVWEIDQNLRKSTDGGATWNAVTFPGTVDLLALDPRVSGTVYAVSNMVFCGFECNQGMEAQFYRSTDGGATWVAPSTQFPPPANGLVVDGSTNPWTIYNGVAYRSVDGGNTWIKNTPPPGVSDNFTVLAVDAAGTLYDAVPVTNQIYVSRDHAQSWSATGTFLPALPMPEAGPPSTKTMVTAGSGGAVYATINQVASSGFVTKLSPDGSAILFSTYLGKYASMQRFSEYLAEPNVMTQQSSISGLALDAAGNATVVGETRGENLPVLGAAQAALAGQADAFATTISSDGSQLLGSTYFGGSSDDGALAAAIDAQGEILFAGQSWSPDFPVSIPVQAPTGVGEAFVTRLPKPGPPVISGVVNGASFQPGIAAGSWVTILGSNLAGTFPGRTWRGSEIVGGILPQSLDGVSVTIDGKAAFVEYISPGQINVQSPSDSATGAVSVVVNNNGMLSAAATAQLQASAPAFFTYPGTNFADASRFPDYAFVANPAVVAGTVAAKPGDILILWGTGFGATSPAVEGGVVVTGAPPVVSTPTVSVGGVPVQVISTVLSTGSVGLYQIAITLPANVPTGSVAIQASVNGQQTAAATIYVASP